MIEYHYVDQGSPEWLEARVGMYTGSNAHKVLGSFGAQEYAKAVESSFTGNFWTRRGHVLEDQALDLYKAIKKVEYMRSEDGKKVGYVTNTDYPGCLYSPDQLTEARGVEVKCFDMPGHMKMVNAKTESDIDLKIRAQIHYGMMICGLKRFDLVAYNPSRDERGTPILSPKQQLVIIPIMYNRNIAGNFKRILSTRKELHAPAESKD